jgi:hypothetical protein
MPLMPPALSLEQQRVLFVIATRLGWQSAIPLRELAETVRITPRVVQQIVKHLIESHHAAIGSITGGDAGVHGYFLIVTREDLEMADRQLTHRIMHTAQRLAHLRRNTPDEVLGQIRLELLEGSRA